MPNIYLHWNLKEEIVIRRIYSLHYNELTKDYVYEGEKHDFWEFLYVDNGELEIVTDVNTYYLKQGDIVFYAPNEFHSLKSNRKTPSNIFIIAFGCRSEAMRFFSYKSLRIGNAERQLLALLIEEGRRAFTTSSPMPKEIKVRKNKPKTPLENTDPSTFGAQQLVKIYLEALLIQLIRSSLEKQAKLDKADKVYQPKLSKITKEKENHKLALQIDQYLEERLRESLSLSTICGDFSLSRTYINTIFREYSGCGIMEHFKRKKIEKAKLFIREEVLNLTEIAEKLGYKSIHYFSRQFKKETGMPPSEYLRTLKARI
ncbi:helix-turn-helix domain-containing protein [Paenibacillus eucommiae]|uniref:AraC-like DNA-binding protein n=1 Tax=Paenibacillus eucommiae TaxID=1355755 RepID=A0ABS4J9N1_9BACL|nr:AraC family transcriptional regulator [Paenibacillus eucommiae]MBP1996564.1 AraC-like DNA-binding protein [Paenibacillus eucommiae]